MDPGRAKPTRFTASNSREEMRVTMSSSKLGNSAQLGPSRGDPHGFDANFGVPDPVAEWKVEAVFITMAENIMGLPGVDITLLIGATELHLSLVL